MKNRFLLISPKTEKHSNLINSTFSILKRKSYQKLPLDALNKLLEIMEGEVYDYVKVLSSYEEQSIEVFVIEVNSILNKKEIELLFKLGIDKLNQFNQNSLGFYIKDWQKVIDVGGIFFWDVLLNESKFSTKNADLFKSNYLPVELSKDGEGVFFEERIINRLVQIGLIEEGDEVIRIIDRGGWENIQNLTATIDIHFQHCDKVMTETLNVTALMPSQPVRPEKLSAIIEQRRLFLKLLKISTTILKSSNGLIYERDIPYSVKKYISSDKNKNVKKIIEETIRIASIVNSGAFDMTNVGYKIKEFEGITDYYEISSETDIALDSDFNLFNVLKTDGEKVYWADLSRNLKKYASLSKESMLELLLKFCHKVFHNYAIKFYKETKKGMAGDVLH